MNYLGDHNASQCIMCYVLCLIYYITILSSSLSHDAMLNEQCIMFDVLHRIISSPLSHDVQFGCKSTKKMTYPNNRIKIFDFCEFCDYLGEKSEE